MNVGEVSNMVNSAGDDKFSPNPLTLSSSVDIAELCRSLKLIISFFKAH